MFFGTPNAGTNVDEKMRLQILKNIGRVAFTRVPRKIETALKLHSDELTDLTEEFLKTEICETKRLLVCSFYEQKGTKMLGQV
jgi:hypothetical protein